MQVCIHACACTLATTLHPPPLPAVSLPAAGLHWGQLYSYCSYTPEPSLQAAYDPAVEFRSYACVFPLWQAYWALALQWAAYWALAVYLNNVVPNEVRRAGSHACCSAHAHAALQHSRLACCPSHMPCCTRRPVPPRHPRLLWLHQVGCRRPWWFLFSTSYWRPRPADQAAALNRVLQQEAAGTSMPPAGEAALEEDVKEEEQRLRQLLLDRTSEQAAQRTRTLAGCMGMRLSACLCPTLADHLPVALPLAGANVSPGGRAYAAELYGLRKVFRARRRPALPASAAVARCRGKPPPPPASDYWAIRGTWLGIEEGQLLCLLGPNGAGKTTTIHCLTGAHSAGASGAVLHAAPAAVPRVRRAPAEQQPSPVPPVLLPGVLPYSGGDALIYGQSISSEGGLDRVRPLMGVCPQFDVLWGELTGAEHLAIYGHIKGLPFAQVGCATWQPHVHAARCALAVLAPVPASASCSCMPRCRCAPRRRRCWSASS